VGDLHCGVERRGRTQLRRSLGPVDAVLFFVVAGSNLRWTAGAAAAGPSSLAVWLIDPNKTPTVVKVIGLTALAKRSNSFGRLLFDERIFAELKIEG
jgi:hypothetical protein